MNCIYDTSYEVGSNHIPMDVFFVGNLTEAGIQPGSTCSVEGCYQYTYTGDSGFIYIMVLTPMEFCTIQGEIKNGYSYI